MLPSPKFQDHVMISPSPAAEISVKVTSKKFAEKLKLAAGPDSVYSATVTSVSLDDVKLFSSVTVKLTVYVPGEAYVYV